MKVEDQIAAVTAAVRILSVLTTEPPNRLWPSQILLMDRLKAHADEMADALAQYEAFELEEIADHNSEEQAIITNVAEQS